VETTRKGVDYVLRPYEAGDAERIEPLLGPSESGEFRTWFRQTYLDNPYVDHVPMFVAEADGEVVGTRPFTAYRIRAGSETELALLHRDTVVRPDHQRRGLFSDLTRLALDYYEDREPAFTFGHSNTKSFPGYRKLGWESLGRRETYARVQRADRLIDVKTRPSLARVLAPVAGTANRLHLAARDAVSRAPSDVTVTRHDTVPVSTMAALYDRRRPATPHVVRDEAFFRWRFGNPEWQPAAAYVAERDGEPVAGVVARDVGDVLSATSIVDLVPRTGGDDWTGAVASLLDRIIADSSDVDSVYLRNPVIPTAVLRARGFLSSHRRPLSMLVHEREVITLGVKPLGTETITIGGHPIEAARNELWSLGH
jgi:predicted N-acetyltransferase YhbS